jgi:hypothetical protein
MRPYGDGFWRQEIGRRAGDIGDIVNGGNGSSMRGRWYRWMVLIMIGLRGEGRGVF